MRTILLSKLLLLCHLFFVWNMGFGMQQQTLEVAGRVTSADGMPQPNVTVSVRGKAISTATDSEGRYRLSGVALGDVLVFSSVGFDTREIKVTGPKVDVTLTSSSEDLEEVVVVGYNTVKRSDLTGSIVSVGSKEIAEFPLNNPLQALQGRAAGVDATSNERPGEMGSVRVRGQRSIEADSGPLYVVDGVPLQSGGLEFLNPKDIETMDVLKDASATAIYGSRGANGVIIVTTKRGRAGRTSLDYSVTSTIENLNDRVTMMNSEQYIEFRRHAFRRAGQYPDEPTLEEDRKIFGQDPHAWANVEKGWVNGTWNGSLVPTTNWTDYVTKTGVTHDHILSASGGTEKMQAYGSFGYLKQDGTQLGQDYQRYTGKFSVDVKPTTWFKFGGTMNLTYGDQNYGYATTNATGPGNIYFAAQGMLPFAVPFDSEGNRINLPGGDVNILNPIQEADYNINERKVLRGFGNIFGEFDLLKGLRYRINFGPDFYQNRNGRYMDAFSINRGGGEPGSTNRAQLDNTMRFTWTLDNLVYYNTHFNKSHNLGVTLLQSATAFRRENSWMIGENLPWNSQRWHQLGSVEKLVGHGSDLEEWQLSSYMGRINYDYKGKYLFTGSIRWDGSSVLADGHKWDTFPSLAVAWRLDQEDFLKDVVWINNLKPRIGYGASGNSSIEAYSTLGRLQPLYYTWGDLVELGYVPSDPSLRDPISMPNKQLAWEKTVQVNYGLDFSLLNNRLSGSIDYYTSWTNNLLLPRGLPLLTGYPTTIANIGSTANRGVDITLQTVNITNDSFSWESSVNLTTNKERIVELANGKNDDIANLWFIGRRIQVHYDFVKDGIWQNTAEDLEEMAKFNANGHQFEPGNIRVRDLNGDYKIDPNDDRMILGHTLPKWNFGFGNTFTYKDFDLTFFVYGRGGFMIRAGRESLQGRFAQRLVDYWTPENPTNEYPAPNYDNAGGDPYASALDYQDGTFVKLRNVSVGYRLPQSTIERFKLANFRVYAQWMNPGLLYSAVDWIDPDLGGSTFNRGVVLGLNIGF